MNDPEGRIHRTLDLIIAHGQTDGAHHKAWVIDQVVCCLTGDDYTTFIEEYCAGEDGPDTYGWDEGTPP